MTTLITAAKETTKLIAVYKQRHYHEFSFACSAQRLVVMVLNDVQCSVKVATPAVIVAADHKVLRDVILGCVQNGNQALGVR